MPSPEPLLTIGVPVYNGAAMLGDMLASLEAQTFRRFQVVICDNASTDATPEIARAFCARDPRFGYHRNAENIGAAPNFNRVWELDHSTRYYKWAAHDDLYAPTYVERCVAALERDPAAVVAFPMTVMVDDTRQGHAAAFMLLEDGIIDRFVDDEGRPAWTIGPLHLAETADPVRRLDEFLNKTIGSFEIFGVMRTAMVERTQLHASYYGSDRALLVQLLLQGPFRQVPERLYINRFHRAASRLMSREEQRHWIDARGGNRWFMLQMHADMVRAVAAAGLPLGTRLRCLGLVLQHFAHQQGGRIGRKLQRLAGWQQRPPAAAGADEVARRNAP